MVDGRQYGKEGAKLTMVLEQACIDQRVGRELEKKCEKADLIKGLPHTAADHDSYVCSIWDINWYIIRTMSS